MLTRLPVTRGTQCQQLVADLTSELIRHAVAEDLRLYSAVCANVPGPAVDVVRETGARARIEQLPAEPAETSPATLTFDTLITQLVCEVDRETCTRNWTCSAGWTCAVTGMARSRRSRTPRWWKGLRRWTRHRV
jgi:hypothetical protein